LITLSQSCCFSASNSFWASGSASCTLGVRTSSQPPTSTMVASSIANQANRFLPVP
jgi:hypothetical protein